VPPHSNYLAYTRNNGTTAPTAAQPAPLMDHRLANEATCHDRAHTGTVEMALAK
jgi:hypothetical protein